MATNTVFQHAAEPAALDIDVDSMVPAKVRKELAEAGEQIREHERNAGLHNRDRARHLWQSALASGDTEQVLKFGSKEQIIKTFEQVRGVQKAMARQIWQQRVKKHVEGVRAKILPLIDAEIAAAEKAERQICERWDVPYAPGPAVLGLQAARHNAEAAGPHAGTEPHGWFCIRGKKGAKK